MLRWMLLAGCLAWLPGVEATLADVPSDRLVPLLADPAQAQRAHYELWRRAVPAEDKGWIEFARQHFGHRTITCPQGAGQPPITLVLYGYLSFRWYDEGFPVVDPDGLFPGEPLPATYRVKEPALDAYLPDGRRVTPFAGDNVLNEPGVILDLDGDGLMERISSTRYGIEGIREVEVLEVSRIRETAEPLLAVVLDWGADDWTFRVVPPTEGHPGVVQLGPRDASGQVIPRAVIGTVPAWGLVGTPATDHLRVLDPAHIWSGLKHMQETGVIFPADPSAPQPAAKDDDEIDADEDDETAAVVPPEAPYHFVSLGTDPGVVTAFMAQGPSICDLEAAHRTASRIPPDVWTLPPAQAALALVEANRSPAHRKRYRLAVDDRDGARPPEHLVLDVSSDSSRCYSDRRTVWRLVSDPQAATLAQARLVQGGAVRFSDDEDLPRFDLQFDAIDAPAARQVAQVVWWLGRVRSLDRLGKRGHRGMSSTADGDGLVTLADATGRILRDWRATRWSGTIPERWTKAYDAEPALNLTLLLMTQGLLPRMGWQERKEQDADDLHAQAARLLARPRGASNAIVLRAVEAVGLHAWHDLAAELARLGGDLPPDLPPLRAREQVERELEATEVHDTKMALYDELFGLEQRQAQTDQSLLAAVQEAQARLAVAQDVPRMAAMVREGHPDWRWAAHRLRVLDPVAFLQALEVRYAASTGYEAECLLSAITRADPARGQALRGQEALAPEDQDAAFPTHRLARARAMADPVARREALRAALADPILTTEVRREALRDLLAEADADLDAVLENLIHPEQAESVPQELLLGVVAALAQRGRTGQTGRILDLLEAATDSFAMRDLLSSSVALVATTPGPEADRLARWLAGQLVTTSMNINEILWAVWTLDRRDLAPAIEALATASPTSYEGPLATRWGGTPQPVAGGRYHLARQIAQIWRETDPAARAVLLLALAHDQPREWDVPGRTWRLTQALAPLQREAGVREVMAAWCRSWREEGKDPEMEKRWRRVMEGNGEVWGR